jgi:tetratricopeptide (TPR) repeat protein
VFAIVLLLALVVPSYAASPAFYFLHQADTAYAKRANLSEARTALVYYQEAMRADPANIEVFWKASRVCWWLGDHAVTDSEKLAHFQNGMDYARAALAHDPNSVESHYWLGCNMGKFGETRGVLKSISLVKPIRKAMAEVLRLNDKYEGGGGYRVLGAVDYHVPAILGGSKKRALENLNKALAIDAKDPFTHYYLADYYRTVGDQDAMRKEWAVLQALRVSDNLKPEYQDLIRKGSKRFAS